MTAVNFGPLVAGATTVAAGQMWYCDGTKWYPLSAVSSPFGVPYIAKVVCVGGETTITFDNIPQNFTDLELTFSGKDTQAGTSSVNLTLQFNGDTTAGNYTSSYYFGSSGSGFSGSNAATSNGGILTSMAQAGGSGAAVDVIIPGYTSTVLPKAVLNTNINVSGSNAASVQNFAWKPASPAAVTSLRLKTAGSGFIAGTTATLYGRGASNLTPAVYQSTTAPGAPFAGQLWWKSDEGTLKIYYGGVWVDASTLSGDPSVCQGRLTLASGTPVTTTDQTSKTTIYWTPYKGNRMALYDGSVWTVLSSPEVSLALGTLTSGKNYDVFGYSNAGALTLELSAAWASDTARTDAITLQDGVYVKSGATTRRYLGTLRTTSTTTTEDSAAKRFVFNHKCRVARNLLNATETADSWTYSTASFRQANANSANQLDYVDGVGDVLLEATVHGGVLNSSASGRFIAVGVGIDSTTTNSAQTFGDQTINTSYMKTGAQYSGYPGLGRHFVAWLELGAGADTQTWLGDNNTPTAYQAGIRGCVVM